MCECEMKAAILVFTEAGAYEDVVAHLKKLKGVNEAFPVTGRADIAVVADVGDLNELSNLALSVVGIKGVTASETLVEVQKR